MRQTKGDLIEVTDLQREDEDYSPQMEEAVARMDYEGPTASQASLRDQKRATPPAPPPIPVHPDEARELHEQGQGTGQKGRRA